MGGIYQTLLITPLKQYIKHMAQYFITFPNTEKRVENTTHSGAFLTNFEVFWQCDETLSRVFDISSIETKAKE